VSRWRKPASDGRLMPYGGADRAVATENGDRHNLGMPIWQTLTRVILPPCTQGVVAVAVFVIVYARNEFSAATASCGFPASPPHL
jgi:hypothetical protein